MKRGKTELPPAPKKVANKELEDLDIMPFGKYAVTSTPMQDVPASYFWYLWTTGMKNDKQSPVARYIRRNLHALMKEHPDGIWD